MPFKLLTPELQKIVDRRFKDSTLPQQLAIPTILSGINTLLIAETGTGKTESAMLPIFNFILTQNPKPISTLYLTPLKSLNRDLIDRMLWWSNQLDIEISVRHGDTTQHERKQQVEFPPQLMFATLETLQPILVGKRIRELLRNVKWVVIDEVHECVDSKRGVQLTLALERLKELCGDFQLIMLSATVAEPEKVASFFSGNKIVKIIKADTVKKMEINVINPKAEPQDKKIAEKIFLPVETATRLRTIMELIKKSRSTLTFTNTREFAEILASRMKSLDKDFPVEIHHSSLSKDVRIKAEKDFKEEKLKSIIATSSLQLGIDIGSVDQVIQYQSPRQISQLVQRTGRSGHELSRISKGIIITTEDDDIFESAVIARKALAGELEKMRFHENSLDVLAHQIIGLTFDFGKINLEKAYEIVRRAVPYQKLSYETFLEVCKQLERIGLAFMDGEIKKRMRGFDYYFSQLSTIPDTKQYKVFNTLDNSFVGVVDEEFVALHGDTNTTFIIKGSMWRINSVEGDKVLVEPTEDIEAAIPGWEGELIPVPFEVAQEVGRLRSWIKELIQKKGAAAELLKKYPIDENCAKEMIDAIKKQIKFGVVPDNKTILIEDTDNLVIIHTCFGTLVNETLGRYLTSLLTSRVGSIGLKTDPYRIMLQFQKKNIDLIKEVLFETKPEYFRSYLEMSLGKSELFEWKFVHVAKRFGAIVRGAELGKVRIKKIVEDYVGSPIYKETLKELETEKLDMDKTEEIIRKIQKKEIGVVFKKGLSYLGKIGIKYKYAEVVGPEKPELEIFELFKKRLLNTKIRLVCTNCGEWEQTYFVKELPDDIKCRKCGARKLAPLKHQIVGATKLVKKILKKSPLTVEEERNSERLKELADLYLVYRSKVAKVLAGRGVGPQTAKRILAKYHKTDDDLLKDVLQAERDFIRTKKYWKV
jgi:ATP-dependent Lhr-like helicase